MAPNNPYNYNYPQSSSQQYPAYKTSSATNDGSQVSRQYQQLPTNQANEYMPYQGQSYGTQASGYNVGNGDSWDVNSHGGVRERTSLAAEALRNMSTHPYTATSTSASHSGFTATSNGSSQSMRHGLAASQPPQAQPRVRSVNTNRAQTTMSRNLPSPAATTGYPSQQMQSSYNQEQRPASQAPYQSNKISARNDGLTTATPQHHQAYDHQPVSNIDAVHQRQTTSSNSYNYESTQNLPQPGPIAPPVSSEGDSYLSQTSTTVDPTAVYDPWPEYQRKAEALRAQKATEEAAHAEEQRRAEEVRKAEEAKKEEERQRQEEAERTRAAEDQAKKTFKNAQKQTAAASTSEAPETTSSGENMLEAEIRAMMAKMRELNSKDPALLARIWEEERRAKAPAKATAVQNKPAPQAVTAPIATPTPPPQVVDQRKKAVPQETPTPNVAKPATPVPAAVATARPQAQPVPSRPSGNTIWPQEKKAELAFVAATYLNNQNPSNHINSGQVLSMLDRNPSYIELCEQLERMGLKLDRAAFAKNLLSTIPDLNATRKPAAQPAPAPVQKAVVVPPAIMKATPATDNSAFSPATYTPYTPGPANAPPAATPVPVAEMVPIKAELRPPANKEEAARKRNLADLVDLTLLSDEEDLGPPSKKINLLDSPHPQIQCDGAMDSDITINNFPTASMPVRTANEAVALPILPPTPLPHVPMAAPLQKRHALRRNSYNPATIARDVLLACGRHPSERQLNQHLDVLRLNVTQVLINSDLTTIRWDILDPGRPPPGYFKASVQALAEDADDEEDSEPEDEKARSRTSADVIGGEGGAQTRVQTLPAATNPFQKRRGRPPRRSLSDDSEPTQSTPNHRSRSPSNMKASASRPSPAGVGYSAFREYGPDGQLLPKKKGRPVGWRKAIHGSPAAYAGNSPNKDKGPAKHAPSQPSSLRAVQIGDEEPILVESRSPSVVSRVPKYHSFKCKWQNCPVELHNLATLKKHVFKMHRKPTMSNTLECLWDGCSKREKGPFSFDLETNWQSHIQQNHLDPVSWELGDGPASGLSDAHDSEAYLSDAQGRLVTPRIRASRVQDEGDSSSLEAPLSAYSGRGRPPKNKQEQEARESQERFVARKRRIGGPGMDRGGATLVNDKRRRGFVDLDEAEEELVDAED